jgi:hypothetical protein
VWIPTRSVRSQTLREALEVERTVKLVRPDDATPMPAGSG